MNLKVRQWTTAAALFVVIVVLASAGIWPFDAELARARELSAFDLVFRERVTLGLVRLTVASVAMFIILSVPALVLAGRWMRALGKDGLTADESVDATAAISGLTKTVEVLIEQRDAALEAARRSQIDAELVTETLETLVESLEA